MKDSERKSQLLFPTQRQTFYHRLTLRLETEFFQQFGYFLTHFLSRHTVDAAEKHEIFLYCKIIIQGEFLRHISDMPFYILVLGCDIIPGYRSFAIARLRKSAQHTHGGCLSGAVGSEETEDFSFMHLESHMVGSREVAKSLCQPFGLDYNFICHGFIPEGS